jgi:hypothetical protein
VSRGREIFVRLGAPVPQVAHGSTGCLQCLPHVELGHREPLAHAGIGRDVPTRVDHLGAGHEPQIAEVPDWFADSHTIWFSSARARSNRSNLRFHRSCARSAAALVRLPGHADLQTTISAPSSDRADSGKALS